MAVIAALWPACNIWWRCHESGMNMKDFCNSGRAETPLAARKRGTCIMADEDQSGWEEVWKDQTQQPTERNPPYEGAWRVAIPA